MGALRRGRARSARARAPRARHGPHLRAAVAVEKRKERGAAAAVHVDARNAFVLHAQPPALLRRAAVAQHVVLAGGERLGQNRRAEVGAHGALEQRLAERATQPRCRRSRVSGDLTAPQAARRGLSAAVALRRRKERGCVVRTGPRPAPSAGGPSRRLRYRGDTPRASARRARPQRSRRQLRHAPRALTGAEQRPERRCRTPRWRLLPSTESKRWTFWAAACRL